jgi:hypothetical protein
MNVVMEQPEGMLFTWSSGFGNAHHGSAEAVLGTDGTITKQRQVRYFPEKVNQPSAAEMVPANRGQSHVQNFLDAIRLGGTPNCPFEIGFRTSLACRMAVESYLQGRTVYWDDELEAIV